MLGFAMIAVANVLAGSTYPAQKLAMEGLPPGTISVLRTLVAMVLMAGFMRMRGIRFGGFSRSDLLRLTFLGVFAYGLPIWLGIVGVRLSTATNGSILVLLEPVVVVLLSWLVLRESIGVLKLVGVAFGLAGALTIVLEGASLSDLTAGEHFTGNVILAIHGVLWGFYAPFVKPLVERGHDSVNVSLTTLVLTLLILVPVSVPELPTIESGPALASSLGYTMFLAVAGSFGATILWITSLRYLPASTTVPFVFIQPLTGILLGTWVLGESLSPAALVGGALIGVGVLSVVLRR